MAETLFGSFYYLIIAISVTLYLILDGFHTGIGCMYLFFGPKQRKSARLAINSIWDMNALWLVIATGALFVGFPETYCTLLQNSYLLAFWLLFSIIARTCALEFRNIQEKPLWDYCIACSNISLAISVGCIAATITGGSCIIESLFFLALFSFHASLFLNLKNKQLHTAIPYLGALLALIFIGAVFSRGQYIELVALLPIALAIAMRQWAKSALFFSALFIAFRVISWTGREAALASSASPACLDALVGIIGIGVPLFLATMGGVYVVVTNKRE
jgi:cytochrome bd-type quinol oxidase subunit 2